MGELFESINRSSDRLQTACEPEKKLSKEEVEL